MHDHDDNLLLSNPSWDDPGPDTIVKNITALSRHLTFSTRIQRNIIVLASKRTPNAYGFLYVPDLPPEDPCVKQAESFVPASAARRSDLPPTDNYNLIALAPWISSTCSKSYIQSASLAPIRALIFYRPGNSSTTPPAATSAVWDIDGSGKWRTQGSFLVFAVPSHAGERMMHHLSLYSGNVTDIPYAQNISDLYAPTANDYVRMWADMDTSTSTSTRGTLFANWVYFLVVVAVLVTVFSATSLTMHLAQAGRRISLRRRVRSGEVNLEAMGITRVPMPMAEIQKFPLYTYRYEPLGTSPTTSPKPLGKSPSSASATKRGQGRFSDVGENATPPQQTISPEPLPANSFAEADPSQPVCAICLERFQNRVTIIREIRCGHIFHPACIDEFLSEVSSLCPICKASMLPAGYCPKITNEMVRREVAIRKLRYNVYDEDGSEDGRRRVWISGVTGAFRNSASNRRDHTRTLSAQTGQIDANGISIGHPRTGSEHVLQDDVGGARGLQLQQH
ncbi:hypothetical protein QBC34DRAFT_452059 [Podospora aff. communis PSN243]|uniref:RING-type E3 ubiquitin transferase n=1 Tax=Podospora aff. communis PSN243 TaxID=3040156 RepID=A0AAV9G879_9PEZI|nr:hypothetical protein QBC34DRAFT_452059 [Podospora aff. communis PSN243]